ncbi:LamG-like jellyroll fold domain-containing protein [Aureibaculum sp. 2210JD6-5]|uniref:LamG-like jellyroll fold domain-containing protein n=1 Tax=Aureibaculum sp. 2210JD6-5 TaxID=3103957 RepID=UPI002AACF8CF|nr:LamG-like jellyroll fold domain-containing protein [Aureibaculum sp. 2210JD6-5]MDY7394329.1 LamG-like jellyroll fold domain-containing protein [Aureibaculum sp. 2210JD6-5]
MKNKTLKYIVLAFIGMLAFSCQDLERPAFSDFLYDGPVITLSNPSSSGSTVVRSTEPIAPITIEFQVEDDLGIANITVTLDGQEIANMTEFSDNKLVTVDNLTQEVSTGSHTLTITATDTNDVVVTETAVFEKIDTPPYMPMYDGEMFYMSFNGDYAEAVSGNGATEVGTPGFSGEAKVGTDAYAGAADSYLTFPAADIKSESFSAAFWYKVNADPNRAGILAMRPPMTGGNHDLTKGFSIFREDAGGKQGIKLNVGMGAQGQWVDGGAASQIDPSIDEWVHVAFTIASDKAVVYINGEIAKESDLASPIDWTGVDLLSIMSGAPNFTQWNHNSDNSYMDELRLFNKALTQNEITRLVADGSKIFNMSFDGSYTENITDTDATEVGTPGFSGEAKVGTDAYAGAADSYLTFPAADIKSESFSAAFWYKVNADPNRAGILAMRPPMTGGNHDLTKGFSIFREDAGGKQGIKLNVGMGAQGQWVDGGAASQIDPSIDEWVHVAFTIASDKAVVYINGEIAKESDLASPIDWTGVDLLSIMSGAPNFTQWNHNSDNSYMDDLKLYNKALSQEEIKAIM